MNQGVIWWHDDKGFWKVFFLLITLSHQNFLCDDRFVTYLNILRFGKTKHTFLAPRILSVCIFPYFPFYYNIILVYFILKMKTSKTQTYRNLLVAISLSKSYAKWNSTVHSINLSKKINISYTVVFFIAEHTLSKSPRNKVSFRKKLRKGRTFKIIFFYPI